MSKDKKIAYMLASEFVPSKDRILPKPSAKEELSNSWQVVVSILQKFIEATFGVTFREQAKRFINQALTRKRKPIKPATVSTWQNCLDKWLDPNLGDMLLANVNNGTMKTLVSKMHAERLSPKSIVNYTGLAKLVVASAVDENGDQLFPRRWNHEFIDMPVVENQHQPTFSTETVSAIAANAEGQERVLYALLAGTGLRIGEALGLDTGKHISDDCRTLYIRQSVWEGVTQTPKTDNAKRDVDLSPALAECSKHLSENEESASSLQTVEGRHSCSPTSFAEACIRSLKKSAYKRLGFIHFGDSAQRTSVRVACRML